MMKESTLLTQTCKWRITLLKAKVQDLLDRIELYPLNDKDVSWCSQAQTDLVSEQARRHTFHKESQPNWSVLGPV